MSEPLRVVLAEDSYLLREGTRRLLEDSGEVVVVAAVGSVEELLDAVDRLDPDVVLTDIRMPPGQQMEGIDAAHRIRAQHPDIGVVVLSQHADDGYAFELLKDGAEGLGYLLKDRLGDVDELVRALRDVQAGRSAIDAAIVELLIGRQQRLADSRLTPLTERELDVLHHMARGRTNAGIARALTLSESAIEKHINMIFAKLGLTQQGEIHRRVAAVLTYLRDRPPSG